MGLDMYLYKMKAPTFTEFEFGSSTKAPWTEYFSQEQTEEKTKFIIEIQNIGQITMKTDSYIDSDKIAADYHMDPDHVYPVSFSSDGIGFHGLDPNETVVISHDLIEEKYVRKVTSPKFAIDFEEIGYWRKANQIHCWFVENVQDGQDNCGYYIVEKEQLQELLDVVNIVLEDHTKAKELLPTASGFFFGDTEYNEWYFNDLESTKSILENVLKISDEELSVIRFVYSSSW